MHQSNENLPNRKSLDGQEVFDLLCLWGLKQQSSLIEDIFIVFWNLEEEKTKKNEEEKTKKNTDDIISKKVFCTPGTVKVFFPKLCKDIQKLIKIRMGTDQKITRHNLKSNVLRFIRYQEKPENLLSFLDEDNKQNVQNLCEQKSQSETEVLNLIVNQYFKKDG